MHSSKELLEMIATEAVEGTAQQHHFDEAKNQERRSYEPVQRTTAPLATYHLALVKHRDGTLEWKD